MTGKGLFEAGFRQREMAYLMTAEDGDESVQPAGHGELGAPAFEQHHLDASEVELFPCHGVRKLDVIVRGSGSGRETAIRTLQTMGMEVTGIKDATPTPHNGCRPKKRRGS